MEVRLDRIVRGRTHVGIVSLMAIVVAACSSPVPASPAADPAKDKLAQIQARRTLLLSTDLAYPPQSSSVEGATRAAGTKCASNHLTSPEVTGYDAETGKLVAAALGVEPCFLSPTWTEITGGNWGDRWDISFGSGGINADRMTRLYMTQPYYSTPQRFFVRADSSFVEPADLSGRAVGVCASCTHELYLQGTLEIPGQNVELAVAEPEIVAFDTEPPGLEAVAAGDIDAFLCAEPVGMQSIAEKLPLRPLADPAFLIYASGFVDRGSALDQRAFLDRVNAVVAGLHDDGTLATLSVEWFGVDYASAAGDFDLTTIGQTGP